MVKFNLGLSQISLPQLPLSGLLSCVYFSRCPTNGELAHRLRIMMMTVMVVTMMVMMMMMTIIVMINDDHDHNHQDNDIYDDDDDDTEMMIRALRVTWVNCGKVGGL